MDRVLAGRDLTIREQAFVHLVNALHAEDREPLVKRAAEVLSVEEVQHANTVIALFNFYNAFVDLHGVDDQTPEAYLASGKRLANHGYR